MYLALVRPKAVQPQGMMQQQKREQIKLQGTVRKAPPITETRKKFCSEAPRNVEKELYQLLEEFADLFLEQLLEGQAPRKGGRIRNHNRGKGLFHLTMPPYCLSPKEHDELQAQIDDLLAQGHICPLQSPYGGPVLSVSKKDGLWRMCIDYCALNKETIRDQYPLLRMDDFLDILGEAKHFHDPRSGLLLSLDSCEGERYTQNRVSDLERPIQISGHAFWCGRTL